MNEPDQQPDQRYHVELADVDYWRRQICCQDACPVHTDARGYVRAIAAGDYRRAYLIARGPNPLASICGRVCGAPCEAACRRGDYDQPIAIRALKGFAAARFGPEELLGELGIDGFVEQQVLAARSGVCDAIDEIGQLLGAIRGGRLRRPDGQGRPHRVAIIGSGPAGLACGHDLALMGMQPVIFEAESVPAGMLFLGVPEYRLPRDLIRAEVAVIEALGVEIRCGVEVGKDITLAELREQFDAVVIAVGAKRSRGLRLPGTDGPGVLGGVDFLRDVALARPIRLGRRVVVIGGGNVAYDVARTSLRQTYFDAARSAVRQPTVGEVHLACLESRDEMPADDVEVHEGDEEGIVRHNSLGPVQILRDADGRVSGVEFQHVSRVFDEARRFAPQFDPQRKTVIEADTVILSVGQAADFSFIDAAASGIELTDRGLVKIDPATLATTAAGVFVAGDAAHGTRLMIDAIASGKQAARSVYSHLTGQAIGSEAIELHRRIDGYQREKGYEGRTRVAIPTSSVQDRLRHPGALVESGYDEASARCEAGRCLDCGVNTIFDGEKCVLCGGCADVCPTLCLKLVGAEELVATNADIGRLVDACLSDEADPAEHSAIIKDETLCIRCANCADRCPTGAITMERFAFSETWQ
ncbi:MAG: NADPH-Fe(3+) oxidoreductase subunit beta [Phycisphaerae bacterium]|nr:NADPH-Fe(3+) oxidoreductase subunit beta [Phycisphaerae bacterium]